MGAPRKKTAPKSLPKAKTPKLLDVTSLRRDIDYDRRVEALEKKPEPAASTTIVEQASGMSIAWCLLLNDLVLAGLAGAAWWYWHAFGLALPPGWGF